MFLEHHFIILKNKLVVSSHISYPISARPVQEQQELQHWRIWRRRTSSTFKTWITGDLYQKIAKSTPKYHKVPKIWRSRTSSTFKTWIPGDLYQRKNSKKYTKAPQSTKNMEELHLFHLPDLDLRSVHLDQTMAPPR